MATQTYNPVQDRGVSWRDYLPFLDWLVNYKREHLSGDVIAGVIVAVMLVPQGMAYALLAGLPPQVGLYASILPLIIYGLLGTSRTLAVGPVAVVSLLVASGIGALNPATTEEYIALALTLALMVGIIQVAMGFLRVGFLVNFLSHPVLSGFTSGAAVMIALSQLKNVFGFDVPRSEQFHALILSTISRIDQTNIAIFAISMASIGVLLYFKFALGKHLKALGVSNVVALTLTKIGPLLIVVGGVLIVSVFGLHQSADVAIVGAVPGGLPPLTIPLFDVATWQALLPIALTISIVSYMESISVGKALAAKRRQKIDANQELIALGAANFGATFTGGYPVTGGFSRSMVNFTAGANTGLASLITAGLVLLTVLFLTPLFYYLPNAVLAAIVVVAVASLVDVGAFLHAWHYDKSDAISLLVTFLAVIQLGVEVGILVGAAASMGLYLWRTSRPHVAVVGRIGETEEYRNILRHETQTFPNILALRVDESLYFPNAQYLEDVVLGHVADNPQIDHFVLVCSAVNYIDISALEVLRDVHERLRDNDIGFYMAEVKGPVMDRLEAIGFADRMGRQNFFLTTHEACKTLRQLGKAQAF
ncbi:MAG: solute carrier 26 family protein [Anaerolineaceae bacterium]|nr:MAG: solute carrier 26 family protein [Anaerolineaceae bacterium]